MIPASASTAAAATLIDPNTDEAAAAASRRAMDRLIESRARLRQALQGADTALGGGVPGQGFGQATPQPAGGWLGRVAGLPLMRLVLDALAGRWRRHPWRTAALVANDLARAVLQPVALRHPWRLVWLSAVVGGLLVVSRPARWLPRPALLIRLAPQLIAQALASPAVRGWLAGRRPAQTPSVP